MINNELTLALIKAESSDEVIRLLSDAGHWDDPHAWRPVGDLPSNYATIGNQQRDPFSALTEKVINSIDAVLIAECRAAGIDPASAQAPQSMREAVARFFEGHTGPLGDSDGRQELWEDRGINSTEIAKRIMVVASGHRVSGRPGPPNISIIDDGEGQTPGAIPDTFMSIHRQNKTSIPFVQGKWNMGGTGAIPFCSDPHNLQIMVTKRDPRSLTGEVPSEDRHWGISVVRKRPRREGERVPVYEYLAPAGASAARPGKVIRSDLESLPLYPSETPDAPFARSASHGTMIKLIEYTWETKDASRSSILLGKSLLAQLESCLPMAALPVRLFEGRDFESRSSAYNAAGLISRLRGSENLEDDGHIEGEIIVEGQRVPATIYVFKADQKVENFMAVHGVVLAVNGQKHGSYPRSFFATKAVDLPKLRKSLGVVLDCSNIDDEIRDTMFMGSRDRIRKNAFSQHLRSGLERMLSENEVLKSINLRRKQEELDRTLADDAPMEDLLRRLMKQSPLLARYFSIGSKVPAPFPGAGAGDGDSSRFTGQKHPTFFRFKGGTTTKTRPAEAGRHVRIDFETDAVNDYFSRARYRGFHRIEAQDASRLSGYWGTLHDGTLTYSFDKIDGSLVGENLVVTFKFGDETLVEPFACSATFKVVPQSKPKKPGSKRRRRNSDSGEGESGSVAQLAIPPIGASSHEKEPGWTDRTAMTVSLAGDKAEYFTYNAKNRFLRDAQKQSKVDGKILEKRFKIGLALLSLALLDDLGNGPQSSDDNGDLDLADEIEKMTSALAPVLLPMVEGLADIDVDDFAPADEDDE